ncbi:MAG TPA: hypothetical protein VFR48_10990 [Solirubrobacteraceae bacterium]|nr:hypothetical protein [Solirubrobacteraceae bacterium]
MFHVELRQFPHNFCRFNMSGQDLRAAVLDAWAGKEWLEFGERKWDPNQASLTVLEGPRLSMQELSMGRGWRNAQRAGSDVTERVLEEARAARAPAGGAAPSAAEHSGGGLSADADVQLLAVELVTLLGQKPQPLMRAWQLALESHPDRSPSECLALAEELVRG